MYARVMNIRFPPAMRAEVVGVAQGLAPILREQRGFNGLNLLTDPGAGEGSPSYIGQMSMMSSFLYEPLVPRTYEVGVRV